MLLFIDEATCKKLKKYQFQYNSCYCLSGFGFCCIKLMSISIQLLLLFIWILLPLLSNHFISIQLLLLFILLDLCNLPGRTVHFNTTLVIVYPGQVKTSIRNAIQFQYNSCYCLSKIRKENNNVRNKFQYNSCYCLSNAFKPFLFFIIASFPDKINVSFVFSQLICFFVFPSLN